MSQQKISLAQSMDIDKCRRLFIDTDTCGRGKLSKNELRNAIEDVLESPISDVVMEAVWKQFAGTSSMDYDQFYNFYDFIGRLMGVYKGGHYGIDSIDVKIQKAFTLFLFNGEVLNLSKSAYENYSVGVECFKDFFILFIRFSVLNSWLARKDPNKTQNVVASYKEFHEKFAEIQAIR
ncbi:hypothetical protein B4U80_12771 [Leptotrombidium deliense]|uniref:EF-hand domain-containing protein n=1 Tax=Leptotrombidium deliense TaxID=299467 RepID=A0A443SMQ7_9ACAR|nr:hypothetical protein B4U80_12771 [Leptotrombidium deliense]